MASNVWSLRVSSALASDARSRQNHHRSGGEDCRLTIKVRSKQHQTRVKTIEWEG
jgi:hypothetical protein